MKFIIIGKNIDVTPGLKEAVESKLGKLERYFTPNTEIHVTLSVQKGHQKIEVTIPVKGGMIRSEQESSDMYVSIDLVEEVIERQLRKYKNKLVAREQDGGNFKQEFFEAEDNIEDDGEIKIVTDENGKLIWECPNCGNRDQNNLFVARRTCGYIGTQFWNQGRTQEIKDRVLHL